MQGHKETMFLDEYLRPCPTPTAPPPPARAILQAWSDLRHPSIHSQPDLLLSSLRTLSSTPRSSLHLSEPQAKLLLSLLSSSPPPSSLPFLFSLLYTWLRKSLRPSPILSSLLPLLSSNPSPHAVLLLGAISLHDSSNRAALDLLCRLLDDALPQLAPSPEPELVLAGIGYALSKSDSTFCRRILGYLLGIWSSGSGLSPSLSSGLMVLKLVEWVVMGFLNLRAFGKIETFCVEISPPMCEEKGYSRFAVVMSCAGVLRAFRMANSSDKLGITARMRSSVEGSIGFLAKYVVSSNGSDFEKRLLLQCMSLGLAKCGPISFNAEVLLSLCLALLNENVPLVAFLGRVALSVEGNYENIVHKQVREHLDSLLFKEAGAATGVLCNQYALADEESKLLVENEMWRYVQALYSNLRSVALLLRGRNDELLQDLKKIAESAFFMVVVLTAEVAKHKLSPKSSDRIRSDVSVRVLVMFSCIEYLRCVRFPEYTDAIRRAVLTVQESAAPCALLVESMPPYIELTNQQGLQQLEGQRYVWCDDEVQTARILFYLRVIPTCIGHVNGSLFGKALAPTMFLYMQHPYEKVARAAHSVFVAFISSGNASKVDDRSALKEQLVFYYMQRALEAYPGVTPYEGLASGVVAVVRHVPAGSRAIFYCIHSLFEKARGLCTKAMSEDGNMWKLWEGNTEPYKKVIELLLRLISLVDVQVLPYTLKQLSEFIAHLPKDGQNVLFGHLFAQVAESDDVTRKPVLVSWLQSLSYFCTLKTKVSGSSSTKTSNVSTFSGDSLSLNMTNSHL